MLKVTKTLIAFLFMSLTVLTTSCSKDDEDSGSASATITYEVNGKSVSATREDGIENVNCTYSEVHDDFWLYGIDVITTDPITGLPGYENRIDLKISNVENLSDLVGQTLVYEFGGSNGMSFTPLYGTAPTPSEIILTVCETASINITSVSGDKVSGTFSADFQLILDETVKYHLTNGKFTNIPILIF